MLEALITSTPIDVIVGMLTYTIPSMQHTDISIPRPFGFEVSERVLEHDTASLFRTLIATYLQQSQRLVECRSPVYIIKKISLDTLTACRLLSRTLGCCRCYFLGLKEARAVAYQVLVLDGCTKPLPTFIELENLVAVFWHCNPSLLIHRSNMFRLKIHVRDLRVFIKKLEELKRLGSVLNFFGYQRFGSRRPVTHLIGRALVKHEWSTALDYLCDEPMPYEEASQIASRLGWLYKRSMENFGASLPFPERYVCYSRSFPIEALRKLPRDLLMLYINAYQSYLFNLALSCTWVIKLRDSAYDIDTALKDLARSAIPLIGYERTLFSDSVVEQCYNRILDYEAIDYTNFKIDELRLKIKGTYRNPFFKILHLNFEACNSNVVALEVELPRGSYVTVLLRELARNLLNYT